MNPLAIIHEINEKFQDEECKKFFDFKYKLDDFQLIGCKAIERNENILVTAHTGSGKTVFALFGIGKCLYENKRVIYTSPIKTLSNQKFKEFSETFDSVGILTGDIKMNPEANCLIMTAEILKNFLVNSETPSYFSMENVTCVILDEVHFINNKDRGHVWEQILFNLNPNIQLIMLSATLSGAQEFVEWIANIKNKKCHLISTFKRVVPLTHSIYWDNKLNIFLNENKWINNVWNETKKDVDLYYKNNKWSIHIFHECLNFLERNNFIPVTVFLLNRELVEKYAKTLYISQNDPEKIKRISFLWNFHLNKYEKLFINTEQWQFVKQLVEKGIGIHHSGLIPILKEIIEILYTEGLLKVLLATETFALGINAPTKTVIFTHLKKFDGQNKRFLYPDEYNQMAGRAGRRGLDLFGNVIILSHKDMITENEAKKMITALPLSIKSKLNLGYDFVLNLIKNNELENIKNTLFYKQENPIINTLYQQKNQISVIDLEENDFKYLEIYKRILDLEEKLKPIDGLIKLNKKLEKKYLQEKKKESLLIPNDKLLNIQKYNNYQKNVSNINQEILFHEQKWNQQIEYINQFLKNQNFIDENNKFTFKGLIMNQINEGNSLILSEIIYQNLLNDLDADVIIAILSLFVSDVEREEILWENLKISQNEKNILYEIEKINDYYQNKNNVLIQQIPFIFDMNWNLSKIMYQASKDWYLGKSWDEIRTYYGDFEGNFIKNILRLSNFVINIFEISKIFQIKNLILKLENVQEKLIRDIVISESLYV